MWCYSSQCEQTDRHTYREGQTRTESDRQGQTWTNKDKQVLSGTERDRQGQAGTEMGCLCFPPVCLCLSLPCPCLSLPFPCLSLLVPAVSLALTGIIGKKLQAQVEGADPSQCNSTIRKNPLIQQNCHKFQTKIVILMPKTNTKTFLTKSISWLKTTSPPVWAWRRHKIYFHKRSFS